MNQEELRYRIYGDDRLSGKLDRISGAGRKTDRTLGSVSNKMGSLKKNIRGAAAEIPGLSSGLRFLGNPLTMAAGGAALLAAGLNSATNEAAKFNTTFRELKNLNLDKTSNQINNLRSDVLSLSALKGFDPFATSKGFYDIQSVTGKYGYEVKKIVGKQGEFADVFQADFNKWIEGTGKAMANYGFGAGKLDAFNRSAYATVNVGSITFDELAGLQADYAGAASSAKQSFDSANKLMTLFTVKTKKAAEAATMTKSAFIDLFKPATIKAFHAAGIEMYDEFTGEAKQVTDIMLELNKLFMSKNSHKEINELRNKFKGSEGLTMLIQTAADNSGGFLRTLEQFNNVDFNLAKAIKDASEDMLTLQQRTENLLATTKIQLGQEMLPWKLEWVKFSLEFMQKLNAWNKGKDVLNSELLRDETGGIRSEYKSKLSRAHLMPAKEFEANQAELVKKYKESQGMLSGYRGDLNMSPNSVANKYNTTPGKAIKFVKDQIKRWKSNSETYTDLIKQFPEYKANPDLNPNKTFGGTDDGGTNDKITKGLNGISGGGSKATTITITIGKLNENININTTQLSEAAPEIEDKMTETLVRAIAGAEQIMAN